MPIRMERAVLEEFFRLDEFALRLSRGAVPIDADLAGLVGRRIEKINVGSTLINDPLAICVCPAREVLVMVCVPSHVLARCTARVEVADSFVIGQEVNAV